MNVHEEISKKVNRTVNMVERYKKLDQQREMEIERVFTKGRKNEEFSVDAINLITTKLNQFAKENHLPLRKMVSKEMILHFLKQE